MVRSETIVIRVSAEDKAELVEAAQSRGMSLTTYLLEGAKGQIRRDQKRQPSTRAFHGVPTFFKALCFEARQGGANGYYAVGHELTRHLSSFPPDDEGEWFSELDGVAELFTDGDYEGTWEWFQRHLPKCMVLVPARRWEQFVEGVFGYLEEHESLY